MKGRMLQKTIATGFIMMVFSFWCGLGGALAVPQDVTDMTISDAVQDELVVDTAVPASRIDVVTTDGIVNLSGIVNSILARERAAQIAGMVKGVRAVVNEIRVVPSILRTDAQIQEDVLMALVNDPATDSYDVDVFVEDNTVTLKGVVDSWQEKRLCARVAKGVKGVKAVENRIRIAETDARSDSEIQAEINRRLDWDILIDNALVNVAVTDGRVTLTGIVGSVAEKNRAALDAYVAGVTSVDTAGLEVERWARDEDLRTKKYAYKTDAEIQAAVNDALLYNPRVASFQIRPEVSGGVVTLRGVVDNLKAKKSAGQSARHTVGVVDVVNRIKVRPTKAASDELVEDRVVSALARDAYVESFEITSTVSNGVVDLYGTVDSYFEKAHAEDVVWRINGVVDVDNHLIVGDTHTAYYYNPYIDPWEINDFDWYDYDPTIPVRSDRSIKEDIQSELFWSPFVDSDDVSVTVDDGEAILTGKVDSWSEYASATENAFEGGALFVDNELEIRTPR